jgi:hypothetical protein
MVWYLELILTPKTYRYDDTVLSLYGIRKLFVKERLRCSVELC